MVANACADALRVAGRDPMVAAILHGSLVLDDFVPGRSDIDILVVVDSPLTGAELAAVKETGAARCVEGSRAIDLRVVTRSVAFRPTRRPEMELYVGCHKSGLEVERRRVEPDLVVEFSGVRAHGQSLIGPEPRSVVGRVPERWIIEYGDQQLARWQRLTDDARMPSSWC